MRADYFTSCGELRPDLGVNARDLLGDLKRPHTGEEMLDEGAAARALCAVGAVYGVQQFADRDHADGTVFVADCGINLGVRDAALKIDQQPGVDQDGHGSLGAATAARMALTSLMNPVSGAGAAAINSRKRAADISLPLGGEITATDAPLRVISISSPSATLLSTSEKLLEASVAVIRVTNVTLSDKSDGGELWVLLLSGRKDLDLSAQATCNARRARPGRWRPSSLPRWKPSLVVAVGCVLMSLTVEDRNRRMLRARDAMDSGFAQALDVAALAQVARVSPAHFSRQFRATFGETPHRYLQRRRVERAMELLRETRRPVTEICFDVGFRSLGTFSRTFRDIVGESPSAYRDRFAGDVASLRVPACWAMTWLRPVG